MSTDPAGVVKALIAAFNRRDGTGVAALLHDDVVCHGIPLEPAHGREAAMAMLAPFLAAEAIDWEILALAVAGRKVLTERIDRFRFAGQDWTAVRAAGILEISDCGRVIAWRDYFDMQELMAAMPGEVTA